MPQRSTYYTDRELNRLEEVAQEHDESFSGVVREAIKEYWEIDE